MITNLKKSDLVLDTIKKASTKLEHYEKKLGMLKKYLAQKDLAESFGDNINKNQLSIILDVWKE